MATKLTYKIGQNNWEIIRDRLALIIKEELDGQSVQWRTGAGTILSPYVNNLDLTGSVWIERQTPIDNSEGNTIIVSTSNIDLDNNTPISQKGSSDFNIDVYCFGKESSSEDGYKNSSLKLQRLCGLIRTILMSPEYLKLNFTTSFINRRMVSKIQFASIGQEHDTTFQRMARITVNVEANESQTDMLPIEAEGYDTVYKIENTSKGFKVITNN